MPKLMVMHSTQSLPITHGSLGIFQGSATASRQHPLNNEGVVGTCCTLKTLFSFCAIDFDFLTPLTCKHVKPMRAKIVDGFSHYVLTRRPAGIIDDITITFFDVIAHPL